MIPILFDGAATAFTSNGLGRLSDAVSCEVNEKLNGEYDLTLKYPANGLHADEITYRRIIYALANQDDGKQAFRIAKIQESLDKQMLTITANHISYDLTGYPVGVFTATGVANALTGLTSHCLVSHPFTITTDLTNTTTTYKVDSVRSFRNCLGGQEGSLIDTFRGELKFDNFDVYLLNNRGSNNGASIRYGKNMESFVNIRSVESAYSGVLSYYKNGETTVTGDIVYASTSANFPVQKILIYDATSNYQSTPTVAQLNSFSSSYITKNSIGKLYIDTMTVSFVPLWQTEEYKYLKEFETVGLGDQVNVVYGNINTTVKAVEYTFDVLNERYKKMVLGQKKTTLLETIRQSV